MMKLSGFNLVLLALFLASFELRSASLGEAVNSPYAEWNVGTTSTNDAVWVVTSDESRFDGLSVVNNSIANYEESWFQAQVVGATNVTFWWKVSSEEYNDTLNFFVYNSDTFSEETGTNGTSSWWEFISYPFDTYSEVTNTSGTSSGWEFISYPLPATGTNILRWSYRKDGGLSEGEDKGWVDEISFAPFALSAPQRLPDGGAQLKLNFGTGWPCRILFSTNLASGVWSELLSTNTSTNVTTLLDPGAATSSQRFYRAVAP